MFLANGCENVGGRPKIIMWLFPLLALAAFGLSSHLTPRNHDTHDYYAVRLDPSADPQAVALSLGATLEGRLGVLQDHYTFSTPRQLSPEVDDVLHELRKRRRNKGVREEDETRTRRPDLAKRLDGLWGVTWSQKQELRRRHQKRITPFFGPRQAPPEDKQLTAEEKAAQARVVQKVEDVAVALEIKDPIYRQQWHILNTVNPGHDLNVTGLWLEGYTGNTSTTAIIDDGLDFKAQDLSDNYFAAGSWDYNDPGPDPLPRLYDDKHGTRCAGEIAAGKNNYCGLGLGYDSKVAGIRILSKAITNEDEAVSVNYAYQENHIYSCSWGPPDDGATMEAPDVLIQRAFVAGVQHGRGGHGSIFVFAAGNGALAGDNCNFDGYTNSIYSVTAGAIDNFGNHPYYSEACSAQLVVTYSSGGTDSIHTTDTGDDKCYGGHGGTSAAGPLVAGTIALALSARPDLSWRDIQYLCVQTAIPVHLNDAEPGAEYQKTSIGKQFSHQYGYGKIDAYAFVHAALDFTSVKPQAWFHSPWLNVQHDIPQGDQGLASSFDITTDMLKTANLERLEHVTVTMNVEHHRRGDLSVELRSPAGVISHLSVARPSDNEPVGYIDWTFMSVAHWGEPGVGTWTVIVKDKVENNKTGTFTDWRLNLWGECIDETIQGLHPYPEDTDDDHEVGSPDAIHTTSVEHPPEPTISANPSDHPERPTKKPSDTSVPATTTITYAGQPTSTEEAAEATQTSDVEEHKDSVWPHIFPTFGLTKKTQIWVYSAVGLIVLFCICLGAYFIYMRRKRARNNPRDDYEFEVLDEEEEGLTSGRKRQRRAGELYDAFAAGDSDEEVFSESDGEGGTGPYKDLPSEKRGREEKRAGSADGT